MGVGRIFRDLFSAIITALQFGVLAPV